MDIIRQRKQGESFKYYFCKPLLILVSKLDTQIGQRLPDVYALKNRIYTFYQFTEHK